MRTSSAQRHQAGLRRLCRIAWIVCLCLATVYLGTALKTMIEHGGTLPVWTMNPAPTEELQGRVLRWEKFEYWYTVVVQLLCYGLFAGLFRAFEQGHYFTQQSVRLIQYLALVYFVSGLLHAGAPPLFGLPSINVATVLAMQVERLLISGAALIAAWVMQEGCRMQEEQALTV